MKRFFYALSVVFISVSLIGCLEIFEYITVEDDKVNMTMNITLSKAMMETLESMDEGSSQSDYDYEDLNEDEINKVFPYEVKINKVNTSTDFGFNVSSSLEKKDMEKLNYEDNPYLPIKKGKSYYMSFADTSSESVPTYRYRLIVSKTYIENIKKVILKLDDESMDVDFYDLGDAYLIDIPVLKLDLDNAVLKIN